MKESELDQARAHWAHRGAERPEFAIEPGPGQESVWDYPRPPRIETDTRFVRIVHDGTVVAETRRAIRWHIKSGFAGPEFLFSKDGRFPTKVHSHARPLRLVQRDLGLR